jgi:HEAT repeat protein
MVKTSPVEKYASVAAALLAATTFIGCADGPIPETRILNPWVRKQWAEDEQRVTTYHRKVADLAEMRAKAAKMSLEEQETSAGHLAARLRDEKSAALRGEFVRTLAAFRAPSAQQALVASMSDDSPSIRVLACKGLGVAPTAEGYQALSHAVSDDGDIDVRIAAAHELGKYKGFEVSKALRPALDDRDPGLQIAAMQSLEAVDGHTEYRRNVAVWREHLDGGNPAPPPAPSIAEVVKQYWSWF